MKKLLLLPLSIFCLFLSAQTYPFADGFESYTNFSSLGTQGGYMSDMSVYQTHGMGNSPKGLQAQMDNFNLRDTTVSPLIGPITSSSQLSFFYRTALTGGLYPSPTQLGATDAIEIYIGSQSLNFYQLVYTINSSNNVADSAFKKIKITAPAGFIGQSGNVKIVVRHTANGNDFFADIDSLVVKDSVAPSGSPLSVSASHTNVLCFGACTGTATATATGGTGTLTYTWSNNLGTGASKSNLCAGSYTITVIDAASGSATASVTISQPTQIAITSTITDVLCHGDSTGCINLTVAGGTPVYTFLWSNSTTLQSPCNLKASNYGVTVLDNNNCSITFSTIVNEPTALSFTTSHNNPSANGFGDGSISVTATGGTPNYQYSFGGGLFGSSSSFSEVHAGCYNVVVKDANNCIAPSANVCLTDPPLSVNNLSSDVISVYPNPANDFIILKTTSFTSSEISIINLLGETVLRETTTGAETRIDIAMLAKGNYVLNIKNEKGNLRKHFSIVR